MLKIFLLLFRQCVGNYVGMYVFELSIGAKWAIFTPFKSITMHLSIFKCARRIFYKIGLMMRPQK